MQQHVPVLGTPGNPTKNYYYGYDALNRLLYGVLNTSGTVNNTEQNISYDVMGNITALARELGATAFDNLVYTYTSGGNATNQLQSIVDNSGNNSGLVAGTTNYTYDGNGNMLTDTNSVNTGQNKTVTYNLLNLPQTVKVQQAMAPSKEVLQKVMDENIDEYSSRFLNTVEKVCEYAFSNETQQMDTTKGTLFGAYNAITGYFQNVKEYKSDEVKLKSILFGNGFNKTQSAFNLCREFEKNGSAVFEMN